MTTEASNRMKVVIYYAAWAIVCTAAAGLLLALIHTWWFSYAPGRSGLLARPVRRYDHRAGPRGRAGCGRARHRKRARALRPRVAGHGVAGPAPRTLRFRDVFRPNGRASDRARLASRHRHTRRRDCAGHAVRHGAAQRRLTSPGPQRAFDEGLDRRLADLAPRAYDRADLGARPVGLERRRPDPRAHRSARLARVSRTRWPAEAAALAAFADDVRAHFTRVVLCGMGGSSLAPEVLRRTFGATAGYPVARAYWTAPTPEPSGPRCATVTCSRHCS